MLRKNLNERHLYNFAHNFAINRLATPSRARVAVQSMVAPRPLDAASIGARLLPTVNLPRRRARYDTQMVQQFAMGYLALLASVAIGWQTGHDFFVWLLPAAILLTLGVLYFRSQRSAKV